MAQPQEIENEQLGAAEELTEQQLDDVVGGNGTGATRSPAARQRQPVMHNHAAGWIAGVIALFVIYTGLRNSGRFR